MASQRLTAVCEFVALAPMDETHRPSEPTIAPPPAISLTVV